MHLNDYSRRGWPSLSLSIFLSFVAYEFRFDHFGGRSNFFVAPLRGYNFFLPSQPRGAWMSSKFMHSWVLHDDGCDFIILLLPTPACWDATQESRKSHAVVNFLHQVRVLAAAAAAVGLCLGGTFRARPNKANRDIIKSNFFFPLTPHCLSLPVVFLQLPTRLAAAR